MIYKLLKYGDSNVLISHLLLVNTYVIPCHYTNLCPHMSQKRTHARTHTIYIYITFKKIYWFAAARETFLYYQCWKQSMQINIFVETVTLLQFLMNGKFKTTAFIWNRILCNIINDTFDHFNASLLNKSINLFFLKVTPLAFKSFCYLFLFILYLNNFWQ